MKKMIALMLVAAMTMVAMVGCGGGSNGNTSETATEIKNEGDPIKVATMTDAEGGNLGQIIVLALKNAGFEVEDETQTLGSTSILRDVETQKQADITVNYTGNGMYITETETDEAWHDYQAGYEKIRDYDEAENGIVWLTPAKANNSEMIAVTKAFAEENNITDMNDFARYVNEGGEVKLATYEYWLEFDQGLPGFEKTYGFKIPEENIVIGDIDLTELAKGTDGINCQMVFTTDGRIEGLDLFVVDDPEHIPPIYSPAPIVVKETLDKYPEIAEVLNPIFEQMTTEDLISMNNKSQAEGASCEEVAREYLEVKGFLK